jgi:signal peptidase I
MTAAHAPAHARPTRRELRKGTAGASTTTADRPSGGAVTRAALRAQKLLLNVAAVVGVVSVVAVVVCLVMGVRPAIVVSGSMAPGIPVGALTIARTVPAATVGVGDVVTVPRNDGDGLVTHRVIETAPAERSGARSLRLQGDANTEPDAVPYTVTEVGRVLGSFPYVGHVVAALQQNIVAVVAGLLVLTALATYPAGRLRTPSPASEPEVPPSTPSGAGPTPVRGTHRRRRT